MDANLTQKHYLRIPNEADIYINQVLLLSNLHSYIIFRNKTSKEKNAEEAGCENVNRVIHQNGADSRVDLILAQANNWPQQTFLASRTVCFGVANKSKFW